MRSSPPRQELVLDLRHHEGLTRFFLPKASCIPAAWLLLLCCTVYDGAANKHPACVAAQAQLLSSSTHNYFILLNSNIHLVLPISRRPANFTKTTPLISQTHQQQLIPTRRITIPSITSRSIHSIPTMGR